MFKKWVFLLSLFLYASPSFALELPPQDEQILNNFFQTMIEKSEAGYVIFGTKPVCIHGFLAEDFFESGHEKHKDMVMIREGSRVWKKMFPNVEEDQNIIIHTYNNPDTLVKAYIHVLFINKKLFLEIVQANLSLFQYVLGPEVTPLGLLSQLTDPNESFHNVLKNDRVLIGILLGYGTQNALYVSRIENIGDINFTPERPPLKSKRAKMTNSLGQMFEEMLLMYTYKKKDSPFQEPTFGFTSLDQELNTLTDKITMSSPILSSETPYFIFGRLKKDEESFKIVSSLEKFQKSIQNILASQTFLKDVLQKIYPNEIIKIFTPLTLLELSFSEIEVKLLPSLVAANIYKIIKYEDVDYQTSYIQGMKDSDQGLEFENTPINSIQFAKFQSLSQVIENIQEADDFFNVLKDDPTVISIIPSKLLYRTIEEGNGPAIESASNVVVHYAIKTPHNRLITDTWKGGEPAQLNLSETIPGFCWGMSGMKINEIREIYIHPTLGYGIYTSLEKGIYLKALVQLVEIDKKQPNERWPELIPLNFSSVINSFIRKDYEEMSKKVSYDAGYQNWKHYKQSHNYNLNEVLGIIEQYKEGTVRDISDTESQDILNRLHWNIYQKKSKPSLKPLEDSLAKSAAFNCAQRFGVRPFSAAFALTVCKPLTSRVQPDAFQGF